MTNYLTHFKKLLFKTLFFAVVFIVFQSSTYAGDEVKLNVTVQNKAMSGSQLAIELQNSGEFSIAFNAGNLPWSGAMFSGFRLFAVPMNITNIPLRRAYALRNPIGKVELLPNKSLSGVIDLDHEFPQLRKMRGKDDVVVFWSYVPVTTDSIQLKPIAGATILNRLSQQ